jgi:hypothetical protein
MRVLSFIALALVGCGGVVTEASNTTDSGVETRVERPEPETSTSSCVRTADHVAISMSGAITSTCDDPAGTPSEITGQIVRTDETSFDLDMCSPAADCIPMIVTVEVKAPGLDLRALKQRSFVKVEHRDQSFFGCHSSIVVTSLDSWAGEKNPADVGGLLYLAAGDGLDPTLPFSVERVQTHCREDVETCGGSVPPDWYSYRFAGTDVAMGNTATFTANGQTLRARNLRAFYEGGCDDYWDFAFWIVRS